MTSKRKSEGEETSLMEDLRDLDTQTLAKHLFARHALDAYTYTTLTMSTLFMTLTARGILDSRLFSAPLWFFGAELPHFPLAFSAFSVGCTYLFNPRVFSSIYGKLLLFGQTASSLVILRAWILSLYYVRSDFSRALRSGRIANKPVSLNALLFTLIPLYWASRRGRPLVFHRDISYADLRVTDPRLSGRWARTPDRLKTLHLMSFRGRMGAWNKLDVIVREDLPANAKAPVMIYYHGGAWIMGDKNFGCSAWLHRVASRGIVVIAANYRLSPEVAFPAHIIDCKRALIWAKANIERYGGDPTKIFVSGESAGGHLSALMATTPNFAPFQPPDAPNADTSVAGAIPHCGVYDWVDEGGHLKDITNWLFDFEVGIRPLVAKGVIQQAFQESKEPFIQASSAQHLKRILAEKDTNAAAQIPPFMIVHGTQDWVASFREAEAFYHLLKRVRSEVGPEEDDVWCPVTEGIHAFGYLPSTKSAMLGDATSDFIYHHSEKRDRAAGILPKLL